MHWITRLLSAAVLLAAPAAWAVTGVNPSGVNVNHAGPTTVFLTFQNLGANERAVEAIWCGAVTTTAVSNTNPCVPGTIFGKLPLRHDLSSVSGTGGVRNFTDIMTIPPSVARRAFQDAQQGAASDFFYVRRFNDGITDTYVTVTCRLAGGGARVPLALTEVRIAFQTTQGERPVYFLERNAPPPPFGAAIRYNGSGRLKGRWEVVLPGDPEPSVRDLLTEATLPIEERGLQRRYTLLGRFDIFLPPTGEAFVPGPDPRNVPSNADGPYKILLRIEASNDKEGDSSTLAGVVASGGVAGFPMPVLRYFIGTPDSLGALERGIREGSLTLMLPQENATLAAARAPTFAWVDVAGAAMYRLEVAGPEGEVLSAIVRAGTSAYTAPPWLSEQAGQPLRWRVTALDEHGSAVAQSHWRAFRLTTESAGTASN